MSDEVIRPPLTSRPPRYRLAMFLVFVDVCIGVCYGPAVRFLVTSGWMSSGPIFTLIFSVLALIEMVFALYFAFVLIDILHRFDDYRRADHWIWILAGVQMVRSGMYVVFNRMLEFFPMPTAVYSTSQLIVMIAVLAVSIGLWFRLRENQSEGLFRLNHFYRWSLLAMAATPLLWRFVRGNLGFPFEFVYMASIIFYGVVLFLIFHRASKAIKAELARE